MDNTGADDPFQVNPGRATGQNGRRGVWRNTPNDRLAEADGPREFYSTVGDLDRWGSAMLDGKVRAEIDLSQIKSKEMPPEAAASLKQMGMDKMVSVVLPEKKSTLVIYPSLRSYAEVPMSKDDASTIDTKYKIETTKLGTETLDGHACVKNKVIVTGEKGDKHEAIVWNATDMKDFPLQMQMNQNEATVVMRYSNIQLVRPDAKQFEAPAGFTKHASVEQMMQGAMLKMLGGK